MSGREAGGIAGAFGCLAVSIALLSYPGGPHVLGLHLGLILRAGMEGALLAAVTLR